MTAATLKIAEISRQISAENDPKKLVILIESLRKLLAEEQRRIEALLASNEAAQLRNAKDHPAARTTKATR